MQNLPSGEPTGNKLGVETRPPTLENNTIITVTGADQRMNSHRASLGGQAYNIASPPHTLYPLVVKYRDSSHIGQHGVVPLPLCEVVA